MLRGLVVDHAVALAVGARPGDLDRIVDAVVVAVGLDARQGDDHERKREQDRDEHGGGVQKRRGWVKFRKSPPIRV